MFGLDVDVQDAVIIQRQDVVIAVVVVIEVEATVLICAHGHSVRVGGIPVVVVLIVIGEHRGGHVVAEAV